MSRLTSATLDTLLEVAQAEAAAEDKPVPIGALVLLVTPGDDEDDLDAVASFAIAGDTPGAGVVFVRGLVEALPPIMEAVDPDGEAGVRLLTGAPDAMRPKGQG